MDCRDDADLGERVGRLILCARDVDELVAREESGQLLDEEAVACHVGVVGVPLAGALLHHQVRVAIAQDTLDAEFLGKSDAVHKGFILGDVVGGGEVDLQCVLEPVALGGG